MNTERKAAKTLSIFVIPMIIGMILFSIITGCDRTNYTETVESTNEKIINLPVGSKIISTSLSSSMLYVTYVDKTTGLIHVKATGIDTRQIESSKITIRETPRDTVYH